MRSVNLRFLTRINADLTATLYESRLFRLWKPIYGIILILHFLEQGKRKDEAFFFKRENKRRLV